ncbi:Ig-like domain repeat protein [Streptomyces yaizuensis]|uniref:Ig-like domain repeat protein n=1 Tax=Streptomyces yaizuensis TaxID=2989713 RepID=A0ABQ5NZQ5_9ACTN|nr:Ig-like domain repeat protein [Streptomyces sp. YSPA8]GLF95835.1 Ig-like domain repeat protein [Streptomyces sp. YSPA8]
MRTRSIPTATALAVLFSSVALVAGTAAPAAADTVKPIDIRATGDIAVDGVHKRVYISDPSTGKILVTDYAGRTIAVLADLPGVKGLALSADSSRLYAAVPGDDSIVSVETATSTRTARYAIGDGTDPETIAVLGDTLWFGYRGNIGSLDLSAAEPAPVLGHRAEALTGTPLVATVPGTPNTLVVAAVNGTSAKLETYDVSTATPERKATGPDFWFPQDLALSADGSQVITASRDAAHRIWKTADLTLAGSYPTPHSSSSVAVHTNGTVATGTWGEYDADVHVFGAGKTKPVRVYDFPRSVSGTSAGDVLKDRSLAWEPGGGRLFAVTVDNWGRHALRTLTDPTKALPTLTVNAPSKASRAKSLTVSGRLTATLPFPTGTQVSVVRTDMESPKGKSLGKKTLASNGTFSFKDTPHSGGKVTYRVSYAGGAQHTPAGGSDSVDVSRDKATLTVDRNKKVYGYGSNVTFTAKLGKTYKNRTVSLYADPAGDGKGRKLIRTGKVNSAGKISAKVKLTRDTVVSAAFGGDSRTAPAGGSSRVGTKVAISTKVTGHYKTQRIAGNTYHVIRKKTDPVFDTRMTGYPNRKQSFQLEYHDGRQWRTNGGDFFTVVNGRSQVKLVGEHYTGFRKRMRSSYIDGTSGDSVNATTHGPWKYYTFTR